MTRRGLFLADGPSDLPLGRHLETLCRDAGSEVEVVDVPADRLPGVGRGVEERLRVLLDEDPEFDIVFVHRDSEERNPGPRYAEVKAAVSAVKFSGPGVAVVPIRMTEAWLLLDESAIRLVAGSPSGTSPLGLPTVQEIERIADPKAVLRDALMAASGHKGRRMKIFRAQFPVHRAQLLQRLDPTGPIRRLSAWQKLAEDVAAAVKG